MPSAPDDRSKILRWEGSCLLPAWDGIAEEEPLEIRVRGRSVVVTLRTPGHDVELAAGFLVADGLLRERGEWVDASPCRQTGAAQDGTILNVHVVPALAGRMKRLQKRRLATSSCGLCGTVDLKDLPVTKALTPTKRRLPRRVLTQLPIKLRRVQEGFERTGGMHAAGIFTLGGRTVVVREDVGRHNAVDKVIGHGFLENLLPFDRHVLFVSGRVSYEIMQKALAAGLSHVAAVSAPSSLAVDFAREHGQTLLGFVRGEGFNVYAHPEGLRL